MGSTGQHAVGTASSWGTGGGGTHNNTRSVRRAPLLVFIPTVLCNTYAALDLCACAPPLPSLAFHRYTFAGTQLGV